MSDTRVILNGAGGRMGKEVIGIIQNDNSLGIMFALEKLDCPDLGKIINFKNGMLPLISWDKNCFPNWEDADVVIDFSTPEAAIKLLREAHLPSVIGVTGFTNKQLAEIKEISKTVPVVQDYNFSTGACVMTAAAENMARIFGVEYDVEISEIHHGEKVDAPSGTAIKLAKAVVKGRGQNYKEVVRMSREGKTGIRPVGEIGIQALRLNGVVGEHTVYFANAHERIELTHKAGSRAVFAKGAVTAAKWVVDKPPGLYTLKDVLGL